MIEIDGKKYVVLEDYRRGRFTGYVCGAVVGFALGYCFGIICVLSGW